jgi:hypothetical protein
MSRLAGRRQYARPYSRPARIGIVIVPMQFQGDVNGYNTLNLLRITIFAAVVICTIAIFSYESTTLNVHNTLLEVTNDTDPFKAHSLRSEKFLADQHVGDGSIHKAQSALTASHDDIEEARKKTHTDEIERSAIAVRPKPFAIDTKEWMLSYFSSKECQKSLPDYQPPSWLKQMFVLIGVQKGGTKAIHTFLEENPQFVARCDEQVSTKELFFFNNITDSDKMKYIDQGALQANYSNFIQNKCPVAIATLVNDAKKMYLDDTPMYIQDSHLIPQFLNCVMPKTKIMAVLRNPTERAFSHYNFYLGRDWCRAKSFDEWVDLNILELNRSGVLTAKNTFEELLAWERYNTKHRDARRCTTIVTRGMYVVQLLHYFTALEAAGRPRSDLHVIRSEDLQGTSRQRVYDKILRFLDLPPHTLRTRNNAVHKTAYESSMDAASRKKLDAFFRPYNQRLYELLDWDPVWG